MRTCTDSRGERARLEAWLAERAAPSPLERWLAALACGYQVLGSPHYRASDGKAFAAVAGEIAVAAAPIGACPVCGDTREPDGWECPGCGSVYPI